MGAINHQHMGGLLWFYWHYMDMCVCIYIYIYLLMDVTPKSSILIGILWLSIINNPWLVVWNMNIIFHFIYGMSSSPLTNSYFSIWLLHHQPDMDRCVCMYIYICVCVCLVNVYIYTYILSYLYVLMYVYIVLYCIHIWYMGFFMDLPSGKR